MIRTTLKPTFRNAGRLALAFSLVGLGTMAAFAGGKSPPPAYDVTLENLSYDLYGIKLSYPKIEIKGANIPKAEIEKMLAAETPQADRLKALKAFTASSVDIPATRFSFERGPLKAGFDCTGDKMEKIAGGKIGKYGFTGCTGQVVKENKTLASFNVAARSGAITDYNFVHAYRLWTDKAGPEDKEAVALSGGSSFEDLNIDVKTPDFDAKIGYGKMTETEPTKIRLLSRPLKEVVEQATRIVSILEDKDILPGEMEQIKQAGLVAVELFENYKPGSAIIENFSLVETFRDRREDRPFTVTAKAGRTEVRGFDQKATDITFSGGKVTGKAASLSMTGFSLAPFVAEAKSILALPMEQFTALVEPSKQAQAAAVRLGLSVYSNLGTYSADDIEINAVGVEKATPAMADDEDTGDEAPKAPAKPETVDFKIGLKNLTFRLEKPVNAIPSSFRLSFDNLRMPTFLLGLDGKASRVQLAEDLKAVGYENLDISYAMDSIWNKDAKELTINEISGKEAATGSVLLKGTIGNFTENMFNTDITVVSLTALGLTAKDVSLHVEDKGGLDRILKFAARQQGTTPEQLKAMVPMMVEMIPEPFASLSPVKTIKDALLKYWENPGKLDVIVKARNGAGLGAADFAAAYKDPSSIESKIDVSATATK